MRKFDALLYDPRKFFASVVILLWMAPLFVVGLVSFSTNAMTNANDGGGYTATSTTTRYNAGDNRTAVNPNRVTDISSDHGGMCSGASGYSASHPCQGTTNQTSRSSGTAMTQTPNNYGTTNNSSGTTGCLHQCQCMCQQAQPTPKVTTRTPVTTTPSPTTTTRTSSAPAPRTKVVYVTRKVPVRSSVNNSARAAAAATAVVNVGAATPQAQSTASTGSTQALAAATYSTPQPQQTAAPQYTAPAPVSKTLPNTGPGNIFKVWSIVTVGGTLAHFFYRRRRLA